MKQFRTYINILIFYLTVSIVLLGALLFRYHSAYPTPKEFNSSNISFDAQNPYHYPPLPYGFVSQHPGGPTPTPIIPYEIPAIVRIPKFSGSLFYTKTSYTKTGKVSQSGIYVTDLTGSEHNEFVRFNKDLQYSDQIKFSKDGTILAWTRDNHLEYILLKEPTLSIRSVSVSKGLLIRSFVFTPNSNEIVFLSGEAVQSDLFKTTQATLNFVTLSEASIRKQIILSQSKVFYPFLSSYDENNFVFLIQDNTTYTLTRGVISQNEIIYTDIRQETSPIYAYDTYNEKLIFSPAWRNDTAAPEIFQYNYTTGEISRFENTTLLPYTRVRTVKFSPSGNKMYYDYGNGDVTRNAIYDFSSQRGRDVDWGSFIYSAAPNDRIIAGVTLYNNSQLELYDTSTDSKKIILLTKRDQQEYLSSPFWYPQ